MRSDTGLRSFFSRGIRRGSLFFLSFGFALLFLMASSASAQNTWVVNGTGESSGTTVCASSPCSTLRSAILAADKDSGDTIDLPGLNGTITLTNGALDITSSMTITGPGASALTISGADATQIFNITAGTATATTVSISGLTLAYGVGAVIPNSTTTVGGAIETGGVTLTVENCVFYGNSVSVSASQPVAEGGAIFNGGALIVENCTFTGNSALASAPSFAGNGADGGAIFQPSPRDTLTIANSTFSGNSATGANVNARGGAIDAGAGGLTVTNSTFTGNSATISGSGFNLNGDGGAVYSSMTSDVSTPTITNSTFSDNSTNGYGGAIFSNTNPALLAVTNSIFTGNSAPAGQGSAIYTATVAENHNLYYQNYATGTTTENDANFTPDGTDKLNANPSLTTLGNFGGPTETMMPEPGSAAICNGNAADLTNALTAANSPDLDVSGAPDLQTPDPDISTTADQRGFPIAPTVGACASPSNVDIGAVQTNYLLVTNTSPTTDASEDCNAAGTGTSCSLADAVGLADGQDYADIGFSPTLVNPTITMTNGQQTLDLSQGSTVIIGPPDAVTISGGGVTQIFQVQRLTTSLHLYGLTLTGGYYALGGAIFNDGTLTVANSTFSNNVSDGVLGGGAIEDNEGPLTVTNSTFYKNSAPLADFGGGAIWSGGPATITNSTFVGNSAASSAFGGGAIFNDGPLTVADSIFDGNSASQGGGIFLAVGAISESNNLFYGNYVIGSPNTESDAYGFTLNANTDVTGVGANPNLAALGNYGGPTQTMLPLPGSAAICKGTPTLPSPLILPTTDQRGFPRTTTCTIDNNPTTRVDIGSVETNYQIAGTPEQAVVETAVNYVNSLYADGVLTSGQDNSLVRELNKALEMASEGKIKGAINNLNDFISEVNDLYSSGVLTYAEATNLLGYANIVLQLFPSQ